MYEIYNMMSHMLPMHTSILISTDDKSQHMNDIVETISKSFLLFSPFINFVSVIINPLFSSFFRIFTIFNF